MPIHSLLVQKSVIVSVIFCLSSLLGVMRESAMAYIFGASQITDAYLVASIIPNFLIGLMDASILTAFITVYSNYLGRQEYGEAEEFINLVLSFFLVGLAIFLVFTGLLAPSALSYIAPSYSHENIELVSNLTLLMMPGVYLYAFMIILMGVNNANLSFTVTAINGLITNIIVLFCALSLVQSLGIYAIAIGTVIATILQLLVQWLASTKHGFRFKIVFDIKNPGLREMFCHFATLAISAIMSQFNQLITRSLATSISIGAVSWLFFANKIVFLPYGIFTGAIGMVLFPILVATIRENDWNAFNQGIYRAFRLMILFTAPAIVGIYVLRFLLVEELFQHGAFSSEDARVAASIIPYYLGALFFGSLIVVQMRIYYALKLIKLAVSIELLGAIMNILLNYKLVDNMGVEGLALSNSLAITFQFMVLSCGLYFQLKMPKLPIVFYKDIFKFLLIVFYASITMGYLVHVYICHISHYWITISNALVTITSVLFGSIVYVLIITMFKLEETILGFGKISSFIYSLQKNRTSTSL